MADQTFNDASKVDNIIKPKKKMGCGKYVAMFLVFAIVIGGGLFWWYYINEFGEGVKSGSLNYVVKKGNIFKTYEGKLIQDGIRSKIPGSIGSETFEFSIENDSIAKIMMENSGKTFDLHYKEYRRALPWRGYAKYIVDEIKSMKDENVRLP